jgi:hypothetical protein
VYSADTLGFEELADFLFLVEDLVFCDEVEVFLLPPPVELAPIITITITTIQNQMRL